MKSALMGWIVTLLFIAPNLQAAPVGTAFTYQGELHHLGEPANGAFDFQFDLYDVSTEGSPLTSTVFINDAVVVDGIFTVGLDFGSAPFNGDQLWLEIAVRDGVREGTYTTLSPRQAVSATPIALFALSGNEGPQGEPGSPGPTGPQGQAGYSGPLYLNGLLKDANGKLIGFPWYRSHFVSTKGFWFQLYVSNGYYTNVAIFFESSDCTGQGYTWVTDLPGQVFLTHVYNEDYVIAYSEIDAIPVTMTTHSLRRFNGTTSGVCETKDSTSAYVPVYANDPAVTGLPSDVGTRGNPFPLPLEIIE